MHEGGYEPNAGASVPHTAPAPCTTSTHGDVCLYDAAVVPASDDASWTGAPDGDTINFHRTSTVSCFAQVDFTYFQTFVSVPASTLVSQFTIDLADMDDGSRITIYNSANESGVVVPGSYVYLGGTATADLASYLVPGINRVVITQVDDCASGNNLGSAVVTLNGGDVGVGSCTCPDADEDGTCDDDDRCPGEDDAADVDGDGVPDGCDACPNDSAVGADLTRTPWEMHQGGLEADTRGEFFVVDAPCTTSTHGDACLYGSAVVPDGSDVAWTPAPNPDTIGFSRPSTLACFAEVDYTYFQTFVNVPRDFSITSFTVDFNGMDDGARITIFNADNADGLVVPGSYVLGGGSGTTDLATYFIEGVNRVVVTQVDDCAVGNNLASAVTTLNGGSVDVGTCTCDDTDADGVCNEVDICEGFDDRTDADFDGVPDGCDVCNGGNDFSDGDVDGVPDACDICLAGDDAVDGDVDGVPDACDICLAGDDAVDGDVDGVPDACDVCAGGDDSVDSDVDGVPDACDICAAGDDAIDTDVDGVPDACDVCDGGDDAIDGDADGVPDDCDICLAGDDAADDDADSVPDACDLCPGADDAADADADGVPDACDACPGEDDTLDDDVDGVPNACDICAAGDDTTDGDADGVPDACDICPGHADDIDDDADGVPDGCDACPFDADVGADLTRTPWQMHQGGLEQGAYGTYHVVTAPCSTTVHGDTCLYGSAVVPDGDDASWTDAPNPDTIGFVRGSSLMCFAEVDYTYFQTFVNVPVGASISSFSVDFSGMDDGSRITIYNSTYGDGLVVPGSYVLGGGSGTTDLATYLTTGVNRVVVTQLDDCATGNNLQSAVTTLNGGSVGVGVCCPDGDGDETCDADDLCVGFDDRLDADADGVPDGCDICAGGNDATDTDTDGVPDACDLCAGFDDAADGDADGVPDGCDICDGADDAADGDADGVPDGCDICPGHDDAADSDGDDVPDGCDACPADPAVGSGLTRTPWEMHQGGFEQGAYGTYHVVSAPCVTSIHGDTCLYGSAVVPSSADVGWGPAPNGDTIAFSRYSSLSCFNEVDYTYFQTFVNVPVDTTISSFTVDFSGMDDGSRITIYNSTYADGLVVPGSYVLGGGTGTTDLATYLTPGVNRVVVTQMDDCATGNNLGSAVTTLNGGSVDVGVCQ